MNERRKFLVQWGAAAATAALSPMAVAKHGWGNRSRAPNAREVFRKQIGKRFTLTSVLDGATTSVKLSAVRDGYVQPGLEQFTLKFGDPNGARLGEGLCHVQVDGLEDFALFVSPSEDGAQSHGYRAHFSLLV